MQLLRMGLVNYTTLGRTFQKEKKDLYIIISLAVNGLELIVCLINLLIALKLNYDFKHNRFKTHRKEGAFFVQIVSDKDIVVIQSKSNTSKKSTIKSGLFASINTLKNSGIIV
jgi:hypothetical protein